MLLLGRERAGLRHDDRDGPPGPRPARAGRAGPAPGDPLAEALDHLPDRLTFLSVSDARRSMLPDLHRRPARPGRVRDRATAIQLPELPGFLFPDAIPPVVMPPVVAVPELLPGAMWRRCRRCCRSRPRSPVREAEGPRVDPGVRSRADPRGRRPAPLPVPVGLRRWRWTTRASGSSPARRSRRSTRRRPCRWRSRCSCRPRIRRGSRRSGPVGDRTSSRSAGGAQLLPAGEQPLPGRHPRQGRQAAAELAGADPAVHRARRAFPANSSSTSHGTARTTRRCSIGCRRSSPSPPTPAEPGMTFYRGFSGKGTVFDPTVPEGVEIAQYHRRDVEHDRRGRGPGGRPLDQAGPRHPLRFRGPEARGDQARARGDWAAIIPAGSTPCSATAR